VKYCSFIALAVILLNSSIYIFSGSNWPYSIPGTGGLVALVDTESSSLSESLVGLLLSSTYKRGLLPFPALRILILLASGLGKLALIYSIKHLLAEEL
jgi:hypothetical protein